MASCIKINSDVKRRHLVAMLSGNVAKVESLLKQNNGKPLPVFDASWGDEYFYFDSYLFSYVLYDALLYDNDDKDSKKEDEKESKLEKKKFLTDSYISTKQSEGDNDRKARLQSRLLKARQMAKKKEDSLKYKQSGEIKLKASLYEGKLPKIGSDDK